MSAWHTTIAYLHAHPGLIKIVIVGLVVLAAAIVLWMCGRFLGVGRDEPQHAGGGHQPKHTVPEWPEEAPAVGVMSLTGPMPKVSGDTYDLPGWEQLPPLPVETRSLPPWEGERSRLPDEPVGVAEAIAMDEAMGFPAPGRLLDDSRFQDALAHVMRPIEPADDEPADLPGAVPGDRGDHRARKRNMWTSLLGGPDPQNLPGPSGARRLAASEPRMAVMPAAEADEPLYPLEMTSVAVAGAGEPVLEGAIVTAPGDEPPTVINNITVNIRTGDWADDGWTTADLSLYAAPELAYVREALTAPWVDGQLILEGAGAT